MANLIVTLENERGQPLNGVLLVNGRYDTSPVPFGSSATTGGGNHIDGTTDQLGQATFSIPYTCVGEWSGTWKADGYQDYVWDQKTGYISGDVHWTLPMVEDETTAGTPPPQNSGANQNAGDIVNQIGASGESVSSAGNKTASDVVGGIEKYWWIIAILIIVVGIALFLIYRGKQGGGGTTVNLSGVKASVG